MTVCSSCKSEIPAGVRWCGMCRSNAHGTGSTLASPASRLGAFFLDIGIPFVALLLMLGLGGATRSPGLGLLAFIGYVAWAITLFANGTTPGKKLLGLRVVRESGESAGFGTMLLREWIGKAISGLIFSLGYLWILFDRDRQGWHDKLVSTYVVR